MRIGINTRRIACALSALLLGILSTGSSARDFEFPIAATDHAGQAWVCRYSVEADDSWYMRCQDLLTVVEDDPVLNDDASPAPTLIPLWAAPLDDSRPNELARAVLCKPDSLCTITLAAR